MDLRTSRGPARAFAIVIDSGVENQTTNYRVVLQPFMCHCRTGEGKRLHLGLGKAGSRSNDRSCSGGPRELLVSRQEEPAEKPRTARFPRQTRLLSIW